MTAGDGASLPVTVFSGWYKTDVCLLFPAFDAAARYNLRVKLPPDYVRWLHELGFDEISFGCGGIKLFTAEEIDEAQVGYSRSIDGKSFCDGKRGSWRPEWITIGYDTALGDPIILDTSTPQLRVMTAMHGEGSWDPKVIADSLPRFGRR